MCGTVLPENAFSKQVLLSLAEPREARESAYLAANAEAALRHLRDLHSPLALPAPAPHPTYASASISTSMSGWINRLTSTIAVAGRISRKNSPCAWPIGSQSSMFVT